MTLFSAHQAAPVHCCSAPQRICSKKSNFCFLFCVQERQQRQKAPKQIRTGACLLPCLFASAALHFRRHAVDSGMDATNVTGNTPRRIRPTVCMLTDQRSRHFARPKKKPKKRFIVLGSRQGIVWKTSETTLLCLDAKERGKTPVRLLFGPT